MLVGTCLQKKTEEKKNLECQKKKISNADMKFVSFKNLYIPCPLSFQNGWTVWICSPLPPLWSTLPALDWECIINAVECNDSSVLSVNISPCSSSAKLHSTHPFISKHGLRQGNNQVLKSGQNRKFAMQVFRKVPFLKHYLHRPIMSIDRWIPFHGEERYWIVHIDTEYDRLGNCLQSH